MMAASAVAVNTAPFGISAMLLNMLGLTASMYAIVRKVVIPARTSVLTEFFCGSKPKSFCRNGAMASVR